MKKYLSRFKENAYVEEEGSLTTLYSYNTPILSIDGQQLVTVHPAYNYSQTTRTHRNLFIREYNVKYGDLDLSNMSSNQLAKTLSLIANESFPKLSVANSDLYKISIQLKSQAKTNINLMLEGSLYQCHVPLDNEDYFVNARVAVLLKIPMKYFLKNENIHLNADWVANLNILLASITLEDELIMPDSPVFESAMVQFQKKLPNVLKNTIISTN